jgi:hypothetical protein
MVAGAQPKLGLDHGISDRPLAGKRTFREVHFAPASVTEHAGLGGDHRVAAFHQRGVNLRGLVASLIQSVTSAPEPLRMPGNSIPIAIGTPKAKIKLRYDPHPISGLTDAPFQDIANAQVASDLSHVEPSAKSSCLRLTAHVRERQYGNRWLVG